MKSNRERKRRKKLRKRLKEEQIKKTLNALDRPVLAKDDNLVDQLLILLSAK